MDDRSKAPSPKEEDPDALRAVKQAEAQASEEAQNAPAVAGESVADPAQDALGSLATSLDAGAATRAEAAQNLRDRSGLVLRGSPVAGGLVLGPLHQKAYDLDRAVARERIARDRIESELNRFHTALMASRKQLAGLKRQLSGRVAENEARILDTHVAYLKDSVFISDVENLILNEQMALEAAIAKVITDFDRIFRLVDNEMLRERAVDLRDVGIRVLRHLEKEAGESGAGTPAPSEYVLVAKELSIVDMFNLEGEHVLGILTEEGGLTSHAAVLARSMGIPTIIGIPDLCEQVREGDFGIVDASEGLVRINPDDLVLAQYQQRKVQGEEVDAGSAADGLSSSARVGLASSDGASKSASIGQLTASVADCKTSDGRAVQLLAACGHLPEVQEAVRLGAPAIGLYRTELLYLVDRDPPSQESLVSHYSAVLESAGELDVNFRLLHVDSGLGVNYLHEVNEPNPALGDFGVRALLANDAVLRTQIQSLLEAFVAHFGKRQSERKLRVVVPFVTDLVELRQVSQMLKAEAHALGVPAEVLSLGVVLETPAAILGVTELAREADFLLLSLVSAVQYLLAADRENPRQVRFFQQPHPVVLRQLARVVQEVEAAGKELCAYGVQALGPMYLPLLLGLGLDRWALPPASAVEVAELLGRLDSRQAITNLETALQASHSAEILALMEGHHPAPLHR